MELWVWLFLFAGIWFYMSKRKEQKRKEEERRARERAKQRKPQQPPPSTRSTSSPKRNRTKATPVSKPTSTRQPGWVPTYDGPLFAQPGEKGDLFGYASYSNTYSLDMPFALIDFETSGFHPKDSRVLEIGVIKMVHDGTIKDEYTTLVNPGDGNVGRTDIHQITLSMLKNAPRLDEVIGDLLKFIDSCILVAHNAKFEENFLSAAFAEVGLSCARIPAIDTLWLSRQVIELPNYKLGTVIEGFGYNFEDAHTAMGDVRAMAKIFPEMLERSKPITYPVQAPTLPSLPGSGKTRVRT